MEEEKDYIFKTVTNSLTKHAKLLEDTKKHVEVFIYIVMIVILCNINSW